MIDPDVTDAKAVADAILENLDAEDRALAAGDMVAYRALAEREARLMDYLKAHMRAQG